ncbi:FecR family protein [Flagellimonas sp.]|uniref:FecR family protein n=1 Tax=Flagellimonas sp. TaxID=2058762 RepID=UPI003B50F902
MVNSITDKELDELCLWLEKQENEQFFYDFVKVNYTSNLIMDNFNNEVIKELLLKKIRHDKRSSYWKKVRGSLKYAAMFIVVISLGVAYWASNQGEDASQLVIEDKDITLQLANGDVRIIKEDGTFEMINGKEKVVVQKNGQQLSYNTDVGAGELAYNQLNVPYGKQLQLSLSDGTLVHLNAGSSLKYPVKFIKGLEKRQVFLQGEAFFDVVKDESAPFMVNTDGINVQVLGTKFNVSSYADNPTTHVVLVEGSVELHKDTADNENVPVVLTPGHKGELVRGMNGEISVQEVNTSHYTSWINGELLFRKSTLKNMLKTLERHYNISIVNTNKDLEEVLFNASFKKEPIENLLTYIDDVMGIEYSIENNLVIIN